MDAKEKGADRTRRTIAYWIFICLLYYFGVEALFKGPFVVFVQVIMLISLSILAYRLTIEIESIINNGIAQKSVILRFTERLSEGHLTRDENPVTHFSTYFLPYNKETKKVFIIHHKKSGLWLSPGGHIDKGETLMATLNREINEELGIENKIREEIKPFLLTITPIKHTNVSCREHLDIWYLIPTTENEINANTEEFHDSRWVTISEARELITDEPNLEALEKTEQVLN